MQYAALAIAFMAALPSALAGNAIIYNDCQFPIFYKSNGGHSGSLKFTQSYSEPIKRAGSVISVGIDAKLETSLSVEYTPSGNVVYYDLSNNAGNPMATHRNELIPSIAGCTEFNCANGDEACYSNNKHLHVGACNVATDLVYTACGKN